MSKHELFKELGLDDHQWDVCSLVYEAREAEIESLRSRLAEAQANECAWEATAQHHYEEARTAERLLAEAEAKLLTARTRITNLLQREHGDQLIMNPDDYLRATLSLIGGSHE